MDFYLKNALNGFLPSYATVTIIKSVDDADFLLSDVDGDDQPEIVILFEKEDKPYLAVLDRENFKWTVSFVRELSKAEENELYFLDDLDVAEELMVVGNTVNLEMLFEKDEDDLEFVALVDGVKYEAKANLKGNDSRGNYLSDYDYGYPTNPDYGSSNYGYSGPTASSQTGGGWIQSVIGADYPGSDMGFQPAIRPNAPGSGSGSKNGWIDYNAPPGGILIEPDTSYGNSNYNPRPDMGYENINYNPGPVPRPKPGMLPPTVTPEPDYGYNTPTDSVLIWPDYNPGPVPRPKPGMISNTPDINPNSYPGEYLVGAQIPYDFMIVDQKIGNAKGGSSKEIIKLAGISKGQNYYESLSVFIEDGNNGPMIQIILPIAYGYDPSLELVNFSGEAYKDIVVRIKSDYTNTRLDVFIYSFNTGELRMIFDSRDFNMIFKGVATYADDYKLIVSMSTGKKFILDISRHYSKGLGQIYGNNGKLFYEQYGRVMTLSQIEFVQYWGEATENLVAVQSILGTAEDDVLGYVATTFYYDYKSNSLQMLRQEAYVKGIHF
ncbi:hypothetical protein [Candidatus Epulonipiscium viviparus]|uniref:hypothetical protein n=1 Tax=Candidatus Epulonipiscium viviparus TaxID=420336 RepID=UPI00016C05CF|nr:hypothetical protein [Candidatus Epulopiscium viviparus]